MSAAELRTVVTDKGNFEYDPDMPIGALKGLLGGAQDSDLDQIIANLAKFVVSWPFDGDPSDPDRDPLHVPDLQPGIPLFKGE